MLRNAFRRKNKIDNIYDEIDRLNFAKEQKSTLLSYFTFNDKAEASAEKALAVCRNDDEKLAYLNKVLILNKNSDLPKKPHLSDSTSVDDSKMFDEVKENLNEEHVKKFNSKNADLKKFAQKLDLKQLEKYAPLKDKDIEKFYEFAGPDLTWPSASRVSTRRIIYDYITNPDPWFVEGQGEELAINTLEYFRLIGSESLDSCKGSHVHIVNGKLVGYGQEISGEELVELNKKNPGMLYAPIKQKSVVIRFSSTANVTLKEWQVHMRIRKKDDLTNEVATMANIEWDTTNNRNFRLVVDSGSTSTVIPHFIREKMSNNDGWNTYPSEANGYGENVDMFQVSTSWEVSLGDGVSWTDWIETKDLFSWQKQVPDNIDCGLVGFDILNSTYQIKVPGKAYIFVTENNAINTINKFTSNNI
ncbi:8466_t:CDS:2 [Funneliformis geosporum]|nr:8466_t:CDS:2 [Funneliformis geosporum]